MNWNSITETALKTLTVFVVFWALSFVASSLLPEQTPLVLHSFDTLMKLAGSVAGNNVF